MTITGMLALMSSVMYTSLCCFKNDYIVAGDNGIYQASANDMNWHRQDFDVEVSKNFTDIIYADNALKIPEELLEA